MIQKIKQFIGNTIPCLFHKMIVTEMKFVLNLDH